MHACSGQSKAQIAIKVDQLTGWEDEEREARRQELSAVLTAVVCEHGGDVFYYQGLHDIAAVLLFTAGEKPAFQMLSSLTVCQLRDCTRLYIVAYRHSCIIDFTICC